ncbi:unnamed protein product [Albugo candida]|uniref:Uncharacterized protein n=1 Tax=Albugo candida TaxID=65357 RepID=A0A024GLP8_9STRA|nr:unnamed protein product [Albugo candida]|eukprot:CCI47267.1 unnamed protein product [Albugo candida]
MGSKNLYQYCWQSPSRKTARTRAATGCSESKLVGLVDEACVIEEVLPRCKVTMAKRPAIPDHAHVGTNRLMRQNVADRIQDAKTEDFEKFLDLMQADKVQKALGL